MDLCIEFQQPLLTLCMHLYVFLVNHSIYFYYCMKRRGSTTRRKECSDRLNIDSNDSLPLQELDYTYKTKKIIIIIKKLSPFHCGGRVNFLQRGRREQLSLRIAYVCLYSSHYLSFAA